MLDPSARQQRRRGRKLRQQQDARRVLHESEQQLADVIRLLVQAVDSIKRCSEIDSEVSDLTHLSAFLQEAAVYFGKRSAVPQILEESLAELQRNVAKFGRLSGEPFTPAEETGKERGVGSQVIVEDKEDRRKRCENPQVDIVMLLESGLMAAQQAFAEYKKMRDHLGLLATEHEAICRLELDTPTFLPFIIDDPSTQVTIAVAPAQAVKCAIDFSNLMKPSSNRLGILVQELEQCFQHLKCCSSEAHAHALQHASCSVLPET